MKPTADRLVLSARARVTSLPGHARLRATARSLNWFRAGCPVPPPPSVKVRMLRRLARLHEARLFVETGTFYGQTVFALRGDFARLYSIELSANLHERASERLARHPHIELVQGDSGVELGRLMPSIDDRCLFWLDGHWSGGVTSRGPNDTPILAELDHILRAPDRGHVIVIDDARMFGLDPAYPLLGELERLVAGSGRNLAMRVENDAIVFAIGIAGARGTTA